MWEFNLVVTLADGGRYRQLLEDLEPWGDFRRTEFLGVVLGRVEDRKLFFETVLQQRQSSLIAFQDLGRVIPIDHTFSFQPTNFIDKVRETVTPYVEELADRRFYVRLERRGMKGQIVSPEVERAIDAFIERELATRDRRAKVDFENPDAIIVLETVGDRCGVGLLRRELMDRFDFVRVG